MTQAIVYIRYSTKEQEKGDSKQRQEEVCRAMCARKGWPVVEQIEDLGRSAWKGDHLKSGKLGLLTTRVHSGEVPADTVLVVEKLDRISRLEPRTTQRWLEDACVAGLKIATVDGDRVYDDHGLRTDLMHTFEILMRGKLAHDESQGKSERVLAAKKRAYEAAKATGRVLTAKCPGWLKPKPDRSGFDVIAERADVIRKIYELSASGLGAPSIAKRLNDDGDKAWGSWRRTHSTQTWEITAVSLMLKQPSVEGDYVPGFSNTKSLGQTKLEGRIVGYYPRIVDADLVGRARKQVAQRKIVRGNKGGAVANLFAGVIRCDECGGPMHIRVNGDKNPQRQLQCYAAARHRGCTNKAHFRYPEFEASALAHILHLALDDRFFARGDDVSRLSIKLAETIKAAEVLLVEKKRLISLAMKTGADDDIASAINELNSHAAQLNEVQASLEAEIGSARGAVSEAAHLARVGDIMSDIHSADPEERQMARLKVQNAIRGIVSSVECSSTDCWPHEPDSQPQKTLTLILKFGAMAIKFDNRGNVLKGMDGHLRTVKISGGTQVADLVRRIEESAA